MSPQKLQENDANFFSKFISRLCMGWFREDPVLAAHWASLAEVLGGLWPGLHPARVGRSLDGSDWDGCL